MADAVVAGAGYVGPGTKMKVLIEAGETLYKGTLVNIDADGYAINYDDTVNHKFAGVVVDTVANAGADGAVAAEVWTEGVFKLDAAGLTQADHGKFVYGLENNSVTLTKAANVGPIGWIFEVLSATSCLVKLCKLPFDAVV